MNNDSDHTHQVEIPNSLYLPKGRARLISTQHWAQNKKTANADATTLDGTRCVTNNDNTTLI